MYFIFKSISIVLSRLPDRVLSLLAHLLAFLVFHIFRIRRRLVLKNLDIAFGNTKSLKQKIRIGYLSVYHFVLTSLELLASGKSAMEAVELMTSADPYRNSRQLAIIGIEGNASIFTGSECLEWAGGKHGANYAVQGNILTGPEVIEAMGKAFEDTNGTLAERMIASLLAGQEAGGDKRGRQSAALLVVREGWGYGGLTDRFRDLRVDDHPTPIKELERIYYIHRKIFPRPDQ